MMEAQEVVKLFPLEGYAGKAGVDAVYQVRSAYDRDPNDKENTKVYIELPEGALEVICRAVNGMPCTGSEFVGTDFPFVMNADLCGLKWELEHWYEEHPEDEE